MSLDQNAVGQRGGRAVLRVLQKIIANGWNKKISLLECNTTLFDKAQIGSTKMIDKNEMARNEAIGEAEDNGADVKLAAAGESNVHEHSRSA